MQSRQSLLCDLISFDRSLNEIIVELRKYPWDSEELLILGRNDIISTLQRYIDNNLTSKDVEDWADSVEVREDISFENGYNEMMKDVIHELANPLLTNVLSLDSAQQLIRKLLINR